MPDPLAPLLAFQVWDVFGWIGQGFFVLRMVHQWLLSEKRKRVTIPPLFWWYSLLGAISLLLYQLHREDPVFLIGIVVSIAIYARNLSLSRAPRDAALRRLSPPVMFGLGLTAFALLAFIFVQTGLRKLEFDQPLPWLLLGFGAQALWSARFVVQWYISERLGRSVLPRSFFVISLVGALGLLAYAIHREDYVMIAAFALNPIPYVRNLMLIRNERKASAAVEVDDA